MTQTPKNPFEREDWFSEVVKSNDTIMESSKQSFNQFQTKYYPQSMSSFQKVLTFFTTHTITAVITASLCLGGIATFAAQQVAPEQFKPTTVVNNLFKNNKIQQTNPNTPLVSDAQNDVVNFKECGLSIKYPKFVGDKQIIAVNNADYYIDPKYAPNNMFSVHLMEKQNFNDIKSTTAEVGIYLDPILINCNEFKQSSSAIPTTSYSIDELNTDTGWFVTPNIETPLKYAKERYVTNIGNNRNLLFKRNNLNYDISFKTKNPNKQGLFGNQIQIQFNDVANNVPNVEVQNLNGVPTSGENFKYDVELQTVGVGNEWSLKDVKTGDLYNIKGDELNQKASKLLELSRPTQQSKSSEAKGMSGGTESTYIFSGKVKNEDGVINTPDTFLITGIDKFELKNAAASDQTKQSSSSSSPNPDFSKVPARTDTNYDNSKNEINLDENTPVSYKSNIKLKVCEESSSYRIPKFYMCLIDNNVFSYRFPDTFQLPNKDKTYIFNGNIKRTMNDVVNDYTVVDGTLVESVDFSKIPARTGAEIKVKVIKDVNFRFAGMGLYQSYQDVNSNDEYIIKGENIPGQEKIEEAVATWNKKLVEKNPGVRFGGGGGTYTFAGEVLDNGSNRFEITKINKFEFKSIE